MLWSLYSKRQTATSVVTTTIIALTVGLFFKVIAPGLIGMKFTRSIETLLGVGLPLFVLALFEFYYYTSGLEAPEALQFEDKPREPSPEMSIHAGAESQNMFGITVIAIASAVVGAGIVVLGMASEYNRVVMSVGFVIFVIAGAGLLRIRRSRRRSAIPEY
jgi:hypothetical protein